MTGYHYSDSVSVLNNSVYSDSVSVLNNSVYSCIFSVYILNNSEFTVPPKKCNQFKCIHTKIEFIYNYQIWVKYIIVLDSNTFLYITELVWCIETSDILKRRAKVQTPSSGPLVWLSCTRQGQSSTEKYLNPNYIFDPGLATTV